MAITTPANKSYNCANKIFEITSDYPIAIMINGNVDFQEIPLETLIGEFSKTVDFKNLKSIENIKSGFIEYLSTHTTYTSTDDYLSWILKSFQRQIIEEIEEYGFDETLNYYSKNEIKSYLKAYRNFSDEFLT